jgi:purine-binding chemotaxis protein CheW
MEKELQIVGFRIGSETYGVRIGSVREIVRVPEITTVPSAPDLIEGVINLRGKIIPVMDLRKRFGSAPTQPDKKNRILVVELENKLIGLIVSSASEVLKIPPSEIEAPGSVFADNESNYVSANSRGASSFSWTLPGFCASPNTASSRRPWNPSRLSGNVSPRYRRHGFPHHATWARSQRKFSLLKPSSSCSRRSSTRNAACFSMSAARTS